MRFKWQSWQAVARSLQISIDNFSFSFDTPYLLLYCEACCVCVWCKLWNEFGRSHCSALTLLRSLGRVRRYPIILCSEASQRVCSRLIKPPCIFTVFSDSLRCHTARLSLTGVLTHINRSSTTGNGKTLLDCWEEVWLTTTVQFCEMSMYKA